MSPPTPSVSGSEPGAMPRNSVAYPTSALALSGLLKVQRRWALGSTATDLACSPEEVGEPRAPIVSPTDLPPGRHFPLAVHLEDSEWSRLALGLAMDAMASLGLTTGADVLQLDPDSVTVHVPSATAPPWPFVAGRLSGSWKLSRDSAHHRFPAGDPGNDRRHRPGCSRHLVREARPPGFGRSLRPGLDDP